MPYQYAIYERMLGIFGFHCYLYATQKCTVSSLATPDVLGPLLQYRTGEKPLSFHRSGRSIFLVIYTVRRSFGYLKCYGLRLRLVHVLQLALKTWNLSLQADGTPCTWIAPSSKHMKSLPKSRWDTWYMNCDELLTHEISPYKQMGRLVHGMRWALNTWNLSTSRWETWYMNCAEL